MPAEVCGPRVEELNGRLTALQARRAELADDEAELFAAPSADELAALVAHVEEVVRDGDRRAVKLLLQAYVERIDVEGRHAIYPRFAVPVVPVSPPEGQMELAGLEPATPGCNFGDNRRHQ